MDPSPANTPNETKETKKDKDKETEAKPAAPAASDLEPQFSKVDLRVGRVLSVKKHPNADSLYVEEIDVGEPQPRVVCSGLVKYLQPEEIIDKDVIVVCNLKPASMRGVTSTAMLLAASNADHTQVELLIAPQGSKPGDRVFVEGHQGDSYEVLNPKKKIWENVMPNLRTNAEATATFKDLPFRTVNGVVKVKSIANGNVK